METLIKFPVRELNYEQALTIQELFIDWCLSDTVDYNIQIDGNKENPTVVFSIPTNQFDVFIENFYNLEAEYDDTFK